MNLRFPRKFVPIHKDTNTKTIKVLYNFKDHLVEKTQTPKFLSWKILELWQDLQNTSCQKPDLHNQCPCLKALKNTRLHTVHRNASLLKMETKVESHLVIWCISPTYPGYDF